MKTEQLIKVLSQQAAREPGLQRPAAAIVLAVIGATFATVVASILLALYRKESIVLADFADHTTLVKLFFALTIMCAAAISIRDFSVPGRRPRIPFVVTVAPFVFIAAATLVDAYSMAEEQWNTPVLQGSWWHCLFEVTLLTVPSFVIMTVAVRQLAPVNLRRAGFFVGLFSGSLSTLCYILHQNNESLMFAALTHSFSIVVAAVVGAALGPRVLRWK